MKSVKNLIIFILLAFYAGSFFVPEPSVYLQQKVLASVREKQCIIEALWHEARSEPEQGIRAVASVIVNRSKSKNYPDSFCRVIHQNKQFSYTHQIKNYVPKPKDSEWYKYHTIVNVASEIVEGSFVPVVPSNVLWYHTTKVNPYSSASMNTVNIIGNHKFLRKGK